MLAMNNKYFCECGKWLLESDDYIRYEEVVDAYPIPDDSVDYTVERLIECPYCHRTYSTLCELNTKDKDYCHYISCEIYFFD